MRWLDETWAPGPDAPEWDRYVASYAHAAPAAMANVRTTLRVLDTGTHRWPVSVNDGDDPPGNSYVVSPLTAYSGYADAEIVRLGRPWLTGPLRLLVKGMGGWLASARLDSLVQVNNWLLSTNVYPGDWDGDDLGAMTHWLQACYPDHALALRSLNRVANPLLIARLASLGYLAVPSRQVYLFDGRARGDAPFLRHHNTRMDAALWRHTPYRVVRGEALDDAQLQRVVDLYGLLYLQKYSRLNPQFEGAWVEAGVREGWLTLRALQHPEGRIDAVVGWFGDAAWLTAPVVGYDTALPQQLGLYRLITRLCLQETADRGCRLNFSSGAAHFKRLRGGVPAIEYTLVCVAHLPQYRRRAWQVLQATLDRVAVPLMKRWKL